MKAKLPFLLFSFVVVANACWQDDTTPPTVAQMLTSSKWYLEKRTDINLDNCYKQSYFEFRADQSFSKRTFYTGEDGNCESLNTTTGVYQLVSDTELHYTPQSGADAILNELTIVEITPQKLVVRDIFNIQYEYDKTPR